MTEGIPDQLFGFRRFIHRMRFNFFALHDVTNAFMLVGVVVQDLVIGAGSLGFDSLAEQIGRSVTIGSPPLRCSSLLPKR